MDEPQLLCPSGAAFQAADPAKSRLRARLPGKIARPTMYTDRVMTNPITRRQFARHLALAATGSALARYHALAAPEKGTKEKGGGTIDYPFWSSKKRPEAPEFVPGLNAILQITPEQQ